VSALLAIETSGFHGSVAVAREGTVFERAIATPREQSDLLLPLIAELLAQAELDLDSLDAIVYGRGPGSFVGLRMAAATAQGLALSADRPVIGVSSLAAAVQRAWEATGAERALVCVDARMGEVYWGCFEVRQGLAEARGAERIGVPETVTIPEWGPWTALGTGFAAYAEALAPLARQAARVIADFPARARDLLPLAAKDWREGRVMRAAGALPTYLRDASAWRRHEP
jgi:tRNA threonylcarbamoyladenosine biosynthesis protein TsaB